MKRQPPAFLERLVGRLIPADSREHVLGDLSERYRSPSRYVLDAARTIPFLIVGQLRRSRGAEVSSFETAALRACLSIASLAILPVMLHLTRGVQTPRWFSAAWMLLLLSYPVWLTLTGMAGESLYGSESPSSLWTRKQTLVQRLEKQERRRKAGAYFAVCICAAPFLSIAAAWMSHLPIPVLNGTFMSSSLAIAILCAFHVMVERAYHRVQIRTLRQQLDSLV